MSALEARLYGERAHALARSPGERRLIGRRVVELMEVEELREVALLALIALAHPPHAHAPADDGSDALPPH